MLNQLPLPGKKFILILDIDRILSVLSAPAYRMLGLRRHISLLVSNSQETGPGSIVQGTYQSPILIQHHQTQKGVRYLDIALRSFE